VLRAAVGGAIFGAVGSAALFAARGYTLSNDWVLVVVLIFATSSTAAAAVAFGLSPFRLIGAGLTGLAVGAWLGSRLIGSYEYEVPVPPEERELRIVGRDGERVVPVPGVPAATVRRVPVGFGVGGLIGWAAGLAVLVYLTRPTGRRSDSEAAREAP
jgi:hypothetical protein